MLLYVQKVKISLEKLVPENHILRVIDKAIDFSFISHIKACANKHKSREVKVAKPIKQYQQELEAEIN